MLRRLLTILPLGWFGIRMPLVVLALACAMSLASSPTLADGGWLAGPGDQTTQAEDHYKFLDANTACQQTVPLPGQFDFPFPYCRTDIRNMRNNNGSQHVGVCVYDWTCNCTDAQGACGAGAGSFGKTFFDGTGYGTAVLLLSEQCSGTFFLGKCYPDTSPPPKANGEPCPDCPRPCLTCGNPVNIGSGNKFQQEPIYRTATGSLQLKLSFNNQPGSNYLSSGPFGTGWTSRYSTRVVDSGQGLVAVNLPDGRQLEFNNIVVTFNGPPHVGIHNFVTGPEGDVFKSDADVNERLVRLRDGSGAFSGWRLTTSASDERLTYNTLGYLINISNRALVNETITYGSKSSIYGRRYDNLPITISDVFGRSLTFGYDEFGRVSTVTDPAGGQYQFEYDGPSGPANANNLTKVTFPDGKTRVYFYDEAAKINGGATCSNPSAALVNSLTGLQDENGTRFATWTYDCQARASSSSHAGGAETYLISYAAGSTTVVDPLGASRTTGLQNTLGMPKNTGETQPAASGSGSASNSYSYDANGNLSTRVDFNGNRTNYSYDPSRNLEASRTEGLSAAGVATAQTRTISTQWDANFRLPSGIAEPLRITAMVYDADGTTCGARGALCSKSIQATSDVDGSQGFGATYVGSARTWTYSYNANGSVLTANGPRTDAADVTTYTYYANNDASAGKRGNVATITNAVGQVTNITAYNAHGQPLTIVDANGLTTALAYDARLRLTSRTVGGEATSYQYDGVGQLTKVTLPDGSFLSYTYDAAHRLTGIQDNLGNRIAYRLDGIGNRTQEQVFDPANTLAQTRSRVYNSVNRLFQDLGAQSQTTQYAYDDQGNVTSVSDPLNHVTANQYDALNRLKQVTDPNTGVTQYAYNGRDALTQVSDPRTLVTGYTVDGLGNLNSQASPDTGSTVNTYDAAGNLLTQTDAKGQVTTYVYDALNRVTSTTFSDGSKQTYGYNQGANGVGRLSSITETNAANQQTNLIQYAYDQHGRVTSETRTVASIAFALGYTYDSSGRLSGLTYPSGRTVAYGFDALGRVNQVTTTQNSQAQVLVQNVQYQPFGGVKSYTLGNGQVYSRTIDQDGRIASYTLGATNYAISFDAASRITAIGANTYGYDVLDRLTSTVLPSSNFGYGYDAVGNRLTKITGAATNTYTYSSSSNRIASLTPASGPARSFVFDANGSTTDDGLNTYAYDTRGRMVQATSSVGATAYQVNALGQRIRKTNPTDDRIFHYDTRGRLIAETDPAGAVRRELFYLGDIPVAVFQ